MLTSLLMDMCGEGDCTPNASGDCSDVCMHQCTDHKEELKILIDAPNTIGRKKEVKNAE